MAAELNFLHTTFCLLHPFLEVFPGTAGFLLYSCFAGIDAEFSAVVVAAASEVAELSEHQASADIAVVFEFLAAVSAVAVEADNSVRPSCFPVPNYDYYPTVPSSVEVVDSGCVGSPSGVRTNCGFCSNFSNVDLHHNKNLGHYYNNPSHGHNIVIDTNDHSINATTSHSRNTGLHLYPEQRKHSLCQV